MIWLTWIGATGTLRPLTSLSTEEWALWLRWTGLPRVHKHIIDRVAGGAVTVVQTGRVMA